MKILKYFRLKLDAQGVEDCRCFDESVARHQVVMCSHCVMTEKTHTVIASHTHTITVSPTPTHTYTHTHVALYLKKC